MKAIASQKYTVYSITGRRATLHMRAAKDEPRNPWFPDTFSVKTDVNPGEARKLGNTFELTLSSVDSD